MSDLLIYYLPEDSGWAIFTASKASSTASKASSKDIRYLNESMHRVSKLNVSMHPITNSESKNISLIDDTEEKYILVLFSPEFFKNHLDILHDFIRDKRGFTLVYKEDEFENNDDYKSFIHNYNINGSDRASLCFLEDNKIGEYLRALRINESKNKVKYKYQSILFLFVLCLESSLFVIALSVLFSPISIPDKAKPLFFALLILIQLVIAIELIGLLRIRKKSLNDEEKNQFSEDLLDNLSKPKENPINSSSENSNKGNVELAEEEYYPLGHLRLNWNEIKVYYRISKKQATHSFVLAFVSCIIGICIMIFAILSPMFEAYSSENNLIPIIGTICGAVAELFAGTTYIVYNKALSQMNLYHEALSHYQNYLSCVNLISKISSKDKQDEMYQKIIEKEMGFTIDSIDLDIDNKKSQKD